MKFFATLAVLVPAAFAIVPTSTVTRRDSTPGLNPDPASLHPKTNAAAAPAVPETNAKRMARGLPPMAPQNMRRHSKTSRAVRPRQSPGVPTQYSGVLEAFGTDGQPLGYLSKDANQYGEYELTTDAFSATPVSFSSPSTGGLITVRAPENSETYPYLGGIVGFNSGSNDLSSDSYHYATIGGVPFSSEGAAKEGSNTFEDATGIEEYSEATIWSYDPSSTVLSAQWINNDGTETMGQIAAVTGFFIITGNVEEVNKQFQETPTPVTFKLVPVPTAGPDAATSTADAAATSTAASESIATDAASTDAAAPTSSADATSTVDAASTDAPTSTDAATSAQATSTA